MKITLNINYKIGDMVYKVQNAHIIRCKITGYVYFGEETQYYTDDYIDICSDNQLFLTRTDAEEALATGRFNGYEKYRD